MKARYHTIIHPLAILCLILLLGSILLSLYTPKLLNADNLQYPAVYRDFAWYHYPLSGWHSSHSPFFFPELALYFIYNAITGNYIIAFHLLAATEVFTVITLFYFISKTLFKKQYHNSLIPILLLSCTVLLMKYQQHSPPHPISSFGNAFCHFGTFMVAILCMYLLLHYWQKSHWLANLSLFAITVLTTLSDNLLLAILGIPLLLTLLLCWWQGNKADKGVAISIIGGCFIGYGVTQLFEYKLNVPLNWPDIHYSIIVFLNQLPLYIKYYSLLSALWIASMLYLIYCGITSTRALQQSQTKLQNDKINLPQLQCLSYYALLSSVLLFAAAICSHSVGGNSSQHYLTPRYTLASIVLPLYAVTCIAPGFAQIRFKAIGTLITNGLLLILLITTLLTVNPNFYQNTSLHLRNYSAMVACVDQHADQYPTHYGLAGYWTARPITFYSKRGLWLNQIDSDGHIYSWMFNHLWFLRSKDNKHRLPRYSFIVVNLSKKQVNTQAIEHNLGQPSKTVSCPQAKIFIYNTPQSIARLNHGFIGFNHTFFNKYLKEP